MHRQMLRTAVTLLALSFACTLHAQTTIEALVEQTGIVAAEVALQDRPGWRTKNHCARHMGFYAELAAGAPDVEIVAVTSQDEAAQHAADADVTVGYCSRLLCGSESRGFRYSRRRRALSGGAAHAARSC